MAVDSTWTEFKGKRKGLINTYTRIGFYNIFEIGILTTGQCYALDLF
jgi:hypothetical protein